MVGVVGSSPIVPTNILRGSPRLSVPVILLYCLTGFFWNHSYPKTGFPFGIINQTLSFLKGFFLYFRLFFDMENSFHLNKGFFMLVPVGFNMALCDIRSVLKLSK